MVDIVEDVLVPIGMPFVHGYFNVRESAFINTRSDSGGNPFELVGDLYLTPTRYLLGGSRKVTHYNLNTQTAKMEWEFKYDDHPALVVLKTALCVVALIPTFIIGCAFKGLGMIAPLARQRLHTVSVTDSFREIDKVALQANKRRYAGMGIRTEPEGRYAASQGKAHERCEQLSKSLRKTVAKEEKIIEELRGLVEVLRNNNILFWADWGTCLGVYRHGGFIPKDQDVDFAILAPDHQAVLKLLKTKLPKDKYRVMDFSPASNRDSLIKVELLKSGMLVDLYHYTVDREEQTVTYNFSHIREPIIPKEARKREIPHTENHIPFSMLFPLRQASFDGLEVYVPNDIEGWLKLIYGEDLTPCKKFDPAVGDYVKDPDHPYWQQSKMNY